MTAASLNRADSECLMHALHNIQRVTGVPGIAVSASVNGVAVSSQVGVASLDSLRQLSGESRFEISCLMKFFVSALTYREYLRGQLDIGMPIVKILPEMGEESPWTRQILIGHLMNHSSGLRGLDISSARIKWAYSWQQFMDHIKGQTPSFPAGSVFNYEHSEHVLLGEILSRHFKLPIDRIIVEQLLQPLGISVGNAQEDKLSSFHFVAEHVYASSSGRYAPTALPGYGKFWYASAPNITMRLVDICAVGIYLLSDEMCGFQDALREATVVLPVQVAANRAHERLPVSFGHMSAQYSDDLVGHNGSAMGQTVALRMDVDRKMVIAVGVNAWVPRARDEVVRALSTILRGAPYKSLDESSEPIPFRLEQLIGSYAPAELVGIYVGSLYGSVEVTLAGENINLWIGPQRTSRTPITISRRADGLYCMATNAPISCAFIRHPIDGSPICQLGVHAYRKIPAF